MGLTPAFKLIAQTQDITLTIAKYLLSIRVCDSIGTESDTVEIVLDNDKHHIQLPQVGARLTVFLGYKETTLTKMGVYTVDELELAGPPNTLTIRAKAADMNASLKAPKTRTWHMVTLQTMIETIAAEHQLQPKISLDLNAVDYKTVHQTRESDLNLLTRLGRQIGAITKISGEHLLCLKQGQANTVSGKALPSIHIEPKQVTSWRVSITNRDTYSCVQATYWDDQAALEKTVHVGHSSPVFTLRQNFQNEQEAYHAAESQFAAFAQSQHHLTLNTIGDPKAMAQTPLHLSGFTDGINGNWIVQTAEHRINHSGYVCCVRASRRHSSA